MKPKNARMALIVMKNTVRYLSHGVFVPKKIDV